MIMFSDDHKPAAFRLICGPHPVKLCAHPPAHSLNQKPHRLAGDNRIAFDPQDVMFICQLLYL